MRRLDTATKNAIIADRLAGIPGEMVARKYAVHEASVARIMMQLKKLTDVKSEVHHTTADYRARLKAKSIAAIESGLDPDPDKYKAGNLGVQVMKGIGEFQGDQPAAGGITVNICIPSTLARPERLVNGMPPEREDSKPLALPENTDQTEGSEDDHKE